ncbi:MAG: TetR/AcrR family transcriptional regulator, partial [Chloroflexota bacterium]|nr:TetR/AcrR family transcriptional regulator [Chloroflexota bacterium]
MTYEAIQAEGQAALRRAILDEAILLLVEEGLQGLSLRRIAGAVGCSTTVLYTLFGGKSGIVEALWLEGFARLWR